MGFREDIKFLHLNLCEPHVMITGLNDIRVLISTNELTERARVTKAMRSHTLDLHILQSKFYNVIVNITRGFLSSLFLLNWLSSLSSIRTQSSVRS